MTLQELLELLCEHRNDIGPLDCPLRVALEHTHPECEELEDLDGKRTNPNPWSAAQVLNLDEDLASGIADGFDRVPPRTHLHELENSVEYLAGLFIGTALSTYESHRLLPPGPT